MQPGLFFPKSDLSVIFFKRKGTASRQSPANQRYEIDVISSVFWQHTGEQMPDSEFSPDARS